jgi:hypothetical protein
MPEEAEWSEHGRICWRCAARGRATGQRGSVVRRAFVAFLAIGVAIGAWSFLHTP